MTIPTEKGSPQGSCLSPELFNIYLADLCRQTEGLTTGLAKTYGASKDYGTRSLYFADDIMIFCHNEDQLIAVWKVIKSWSAKFEIPINYAKSGVLELRVDQRTPTSFFNPIADVPLVK